MGFGAMPAQRIYAHRPFAAQLSAMIRVRNKKNKTPRCVPAGRQGKIEMRLFILYNLQLEIINFLYKNLRKAKC